MRALDTVAAITGRDPEDTGGGCMVITYPHPTRAGYVVDVSEHDEEHVTVTARHLADDGDICGCDDGEGLWAWERARPEHVERALFDAQTFIASHVCEVAR